MEYCHWQMGYWMNVMIEIDRDYENVYFKMHCLYNAKTEIYDRSLTNIRDKYDSTSAYIGEIRSKSNSYAFRLYSWCKDIIIKETGRSFDFNMWKESVSKYMNLSAQGWIDLYEYLVENGEIIKFECLYSREVESDN